MTHPARTGQFWRVSDWCAGPAGLRAARAAGGEGRREGEGRPGCGTWGLGWCFTVDHKQRHKTPTSHKVTLWPWWRETKMRRSVILPAAAAAKSLQSCLTLCDPLDSSPPGPAIPGILQARTLEWVAISFSNAWKWKGKVKSLSRVRLLVTPWTAAYWAPPSMGFSRQEYQSGVPLHSPHSAWMHPKTKIAMTPQKYRVYLLGRLFPPITALALFHSPTRR